MPGLCGSSVLGTLLLALSCGALAGGGETANAAPPFFQAALPDATLADALEHGRASFKAAHYQDAVQHFQAAVAFDPGSPEALLLLGTAYASQVIPNLDTPENVGFAEKAIASLKQVPQSSPEFLPALKQVAAVEREVKRLEQSKATELEVLRLAPTDAQAHYTIAVIDWMQAYRNAVARLATYNLQDDGLGNAKLNASACQELALSNTPLVDDGLDHLQRTVELSPTNDDAMSYMNLLYRRRADFACGDEAVRQQAINQAGLWSAKATTARSARQTQSTLK